MPIKSLADFNDIEEPGELINVRVPADLKADFEDVRKRMRAARKDFPRAYRKHLREFIDLCKALLDKNGVGHSNGKA
jgi:hypothetical protein